MLTIYQTIMEWSDLHPVLSYYLGILLTVISAVCCVLFVALRDIEYRNYYSPDVIYQLRFYNRNRTHRLGYFSGGRIKD